MLSEDQQIKILKSQFVTSGVEFFPTLTLTLSRGGGRGNFRSPRLRGEGQGEGRAVNYLADRI